MIHKHGGNIYEHEQVTDFSANINFRGMPESVRRGALEAVDASVHYPDPDYGSLREAIANREQVKKDQVICGNGAAELMFALAFAIKPGRALLAVPSFFEYEQALGAVGCEMDYCFLKEKEAYQVTASFPERINDTYDVVILGNPNNPTGQLIKREILEAILKRCREKGILLVMDESFFDFLCPADQARTLECVHEISRNSRLLVLKSFTKMYGMPGLRFGYGVSSDTELLRHMREIMQPWNVSLPAQKAAEAAAGEVLFARETAEQVAANREWMETQLKAAGYQVFGSCTNYLLLKGPVDLAARCLEQGILIRDCSNFRGLPEGYFRICIRSEEENKRLLQALRQDQDHPAGYPDPGEPEAAEGASGC